MTHAIAEQGFGWVPVDRPRAERRNRMGDRPSAGSIKGERSGLLVLVVLRCAFDRRDPALAPLHPDLVFGLQLEGRLIQTSDPNLDESVAESVVSRSRDPQRGRKPRLS